MNPYKADAKYVACDSGALDRNCKHRVQKNIKLQVYYTIINKESQQKSDKSGYNFEKAVFGRTLWLKTIYFSKTS